MKNAMIWGADGGIGSSVDQLLSAQGWTTATVGRDLTKANDSSLTFHADFSEPYEVQTAVQAAAMELDSVDLWIYCAGDIASAKLAEMDPSTWNNIIGANLTGVYTTLHFSLPLLTEKAHIFVVGAVSERLRLPGLSAYAAAKAGLEAFMDAVAKEERKRKVTVFRPGAVQTEFWDKVPFRMPADALSPDTVASAVLRAYDEGQTGRLDL